MNNTRLSHGLPKCFLEVTILEHNAEYNRYVVKSSIFDGTPFLVRNVEPRMLEIDSDDSKKGLLEVGQGPDSSGNTSIVLPAPSEPFGYDVRVRADQIRRETYKVVTPTKVRVPKK